jgi:hypothetical protein
MDIRMLTEFFLWCTIINGALLVLWTGMCMAAPDLVYRTQSRWFPIPRATYDVVMYAFLGLFKVLVLIFNVVPLIALLIIV